MCKFVQVTVEDVFLTYMTKNHYLQGFYPPVEEKRLVHKTMNEQCSQVYNLVFIRTKLSVSVYNIKKIIGCQENNHYDMDTLGKDFKENMGFKLCSE